MTKGRAEKLTMGKSRGERRVIFSSSGAIPTIHDLRRPRAKTELRVLEKELKGGSRESVFEIVEEGVNDVDEVEAGDGATNNSDFGVEDGRQRDKKEYAIRGGACNCVPYLLLPMPTEYPLVTRPTTRERERGEKVPNSQNTSFFGFGPGPISAGPKFSPIAKELIFSFFFSFLFFLFLFLRGQLD